MKNKKTLVLGASIKSQRYSNMAIKSLVQKGHSVIAIGHDVGEVAGVKIHKKAIREIRNNFKCRFTYY